MQNPLAQTASTTEGAPRAARINYRGTKPADAEHDARTPTLGVHGECAFPLGPPLVDLKGAITSPYPGCGGHTLYRVPPPGRQGVWRDGGSFGKHMQAEPPPPTDGTLGCHRRPWVSHPGGHWGDHAIRPVIPVVAIGVQSLSNSADPIKRARGPNYLRDTPEGKPLPFLG